MSLNSSRIPWYHSWFGSDYLEVYQHRSAQEAAAAVVWLTDLLQLRPPDRVLDLACGAGRHSRHLAQFGFPTVGLDLSWSLLRRSSGASRWQRLRGDMRDLPLRDDSFRLILSLFTSFGYFSSDAEELRVLAEIARVLEPQGWFALDFLNAERVKREIVAEEEIQVNGKQIHVRRWVDEINGRIEKSIVITASDGKARRYRESVRLYTQPELERLLGTVGFKVRKSFGDYHGGEISNLAPRLILIAQKNA